MSCWGDNASFDFTKFDTLFVNVKNTKNKVHIAANRLRYPIDLTDEYRKGYLAALSRYAKAIVEECINKNDVDLLRFLGTLGIIKKNNIDAYLKYAETAKHVEVTAYLMDYRNSNFGGGDADAIISDFTKQLDNASPDKLWAFSKSSPTKIGRYKGTEIEVYYPEELKGKKVTGLADTSASIPSHYANITKVVLPDGYTTIGAYSFAGCTNLKEINIPDTVTSIGKAAFSKCTSLEHIVLPESLIRIDEQAFFGCSSLKEIIIPDTVTHINAEAFCACKSLEKLKLSRNLTYISNEAFAYCKSLHIIHIPRKVTGMSNAFKCGAAQHVWVHSAKLTDIWGTNFSDPVEFYSYPDAVGRMYGVYKHSRKELKLSDLPSDTEIKIEAYDDKSNALTFSFHMEDAAASIRNAAKPEKMFGAAKTADKLAGLMEDVYGEELHNEANDSMLAEILDLASTKLNGNIVITEIKTNEDGKAVTTYTFADGAGKMEVKDTFIEDMK